jgi:hypothetical protein
MRKIKGEIEPTNKEAILGSLLEVRKAKPFNPFQSMLDDFTKSPEEAIKLTYPSKRKATLVAMNVRFRVPYNNGHTTITVVQRQNVIFLIKGDRIQVQKELIDQGLFIGRRTKRKK